MRISDWSSDVCSSDLFLSSDVVCDDKVVITASDDGAELGVLSPRSHVAWATRLGGWLGMGNDSVYVKTKTFHPFPFPSATPHQRQIIGDLTQEPYVNPQAVLAAHCNRHITGPTNFPPNGKESK